MDAHYLQANIAYARRTRYGTVCLLSTITNSNQDITLAHRGVVVVLALVLTVHAVVRQTEDAMRDDRCRRLSGIVLHEEDLGRLDVLQHQDRQDIVQDPNHPDV